MRLAVLMCLAAGCAEMVPSGSLWEPVVVSDAPAAAAPAESAVAPDVAAAPQTPAPGFDFDAEDRDDDDEAGGATDPAALQAKLLGVSADALAPAPPQEAPPRVVVTPVADTIPQWDPATVLPQTTFGVRVLATLLDMSPPRAVLGLPDGTEQVVQPGAMLAEQRIVVLAIGRDAVQLAEITPQGFYAAVSTRTVPALYPGAVDAP